MFVMYVLRNLVALIRSITTVQNKLTMNIFILSKKLDKEFV